MPLHLIEHLEDTEGEPVRIVALNGNLTIETGDPEHPTRLELSDLASLSEVAQIVARALSHAAFELSEARRCGRIAPRAEVATLDRVSNAAGLLEASAEYLRTTR